MNKIMTERFSSGKITYSSPVLNRYFIVIPEWILNFANIKKKVLSLSLLVVNF